MKIFLVFTFTVLFISTISGNTINRSIIRLPKHFKVERTFSGNLSNTKSFHLIFSKNRKTKKYSVHSYLFNGNEVEELSSIIDDKLFSVVSFHQENNVLSVLYSFEGEEKKSYLKRVDYNLQDKKKKAIKSEVFFHEDLLTTIRLKGKSILIYNEKEKLVIKEFEGSLSVVKKEYYFKKDKDEVKDFFKNESVTSIKTDEFVANGSTNKMKLYYGNNTLFFTKDSDEPLYINVGGFSLNNKRANITKVLRLNLDESNLAPNFLTFNNGEGEKFKKATSYFSNNKLFQLALSKKKGFIKISDVTNGKALNTIVLDNSLTKYIKGSAKFNGIEKFLKNAGRNKYDATITVNETNEKDKLIVRLDYVNKGYSYHYNWWLHHQRMMFHHQQMMLNNARISVPSGFGPSQLDNFSFELVSTKKKKHFFELLINANGMLSNEELPETVYKEIDKKKYIDKLEDIKDLKHQSSCFLKNSFRYIGYSKELKGFVFNTNRIR